MRVSEFDYARPRELIAHHPAPRRDASRLLRLDAGGRVHDLRFADFPALLRPGDALVVNDTRVIKALLSSPESNGAALEIFIERIVGLREALVLIRASHPPQPGSEISIG